MIAAQRHPHSSALRRCALTALGYGLRVANQGIASLVDVYWMQRVNAGVLHDNFGRISGFNKAIIIL